MNKGYEQAVQNLAYKIIEFSRRDLDPVADQLETMDQMLQHIENNPSMLRDWDKLEEVTDVICKTYNVDFVQLSEDVWNMMMEYESFDPEFLN